MTFSLVGRCAETGAVGIAIATSSIAVGARCPFVRAGVGAVASQNVTDPRLGPLVLDALEAGADAATAVAEIVGRTPHAAYRQVLCVDRAGRTAIHSGTEALGTVGETQGEGCAAAGNLLASPEVPAAMVRAFEATAGRALSARLLGALEAALEAGGEAGEVHSAALLVATDQAWPYVDLRCDWADADPVGAVARLWEAYAGQADDYVTRALDPGAAPSYGVPGDP